MTWTELPVNRTIPHRAAGRCPMVQVASRVSSVDVVDSYGHTGSAGMRFILEREFSTLNRRLWRRITTVK